MNPEYCLYCLKTKYTILFYMYVSLCYLKPKTTDFIKILFRSFNNFYVKYYVEHK